MTGVRLGSWRLLPDMLRRKVLQLLPAGSAHEVPPKSLASYRVEELNLALTQVDLVCEFQVHDADALPFELSITKLELWPLDAHDS